MVLSLNHNRTQGMGLLFFQNKTEVANQYTIPS